MWNINNWLIIDEVNKTFYKRKKSLDKQMVEAAASVPKQDSTITPVKLVIGMAGQEKGTVNVAIE